MKTDTNLARIASVYRFALRRLGAAYMAGTDAHVNRWLAAVEHARRRMSALSVA